MAKNQKSYTPEFEQQIVDLQLSPIQISPEETVTLKEFKAIQKENQRLKIENEILKQSHSHRRWHLPYSQKNNNRTCDFYPKQP